MTWLSVHVYYHDPLDRLIDGAVRPLIARLGDALAGWFFVRYWQGGPHLRLRLRPRGDDAAIAGELDAALAAFLRAAPAQATLAPEAYAAMAAPLAAAEPGARAVEPLAANNSVAHRAYEPEVARYGGTPATMAAAERQFTASSELALEVIAAGRGRDHRTGQALAMAYLAAAACAPAGAARIAFCRAGRDGPARMFGGLDDAALEPRYQRQRAQLADLADRLDAVRPGDGALGRWLAAVTRLGDELGLAPAARDDVVRRCVHMHTNRLGISLPEEVYLRFLVWRMASERGGTR